MSAHSPATCASMCVSTARVDIPASAQRDISCREQECVKTSTSVTQATSVGTMRCAGTITEVIAVTLRTRVTSLTCWRQKTGVRASLQLRVEACHSLSFTNTWAFIQSAPYQQISSRFRPQTSSPAHTTPSGLKLETMQENSSLGGSAALVRCWSWPSPWRAHRSWSLIWRWSLNTQQWTIAQALYCGSPSLWDPTPSNNAASHIYTLALTLHAATVRCYELFYCVFIWQPSYSYSGLPLK